MLENLTLRRQLIKRRCHARQSFPHHFRFAADADSEMFPRLKKSSRHHARLIFFAQKLAERLRVPASELRECDRSRLRPDREQIFAGIEKLFQQSTIRLEKSFCASRDLREVIERHHAQKLGWMRRHHAEEIVEPPHPL